MFGWTPRRLWPLVTTGGLLVALAVTAVVATPGVKSLPIPRIWESQAVASHAAAERSAGIAQPTPPKAQQAWHAPHWLTVLISVGCTLLGIAVLALLAWQLIKMWLETRAAKLARLAPAGSALAATRREAVIAAVDASIAELASEDGDARSAVIACWVRLEEVAAVAGTRREPGDTPANLVDRLLRSHQVSAEVLYSLAELYREARYSTRLIESSMRLTARIAFGQLREELAQSRSGPLAGDPVLSSVSVEPHRPRPSAPVGEPR